jgi:hypothetical protein
MTTINPRFPTADQMSDLAYWRSLLPEYDVSDRPFLSASGSYQFPDAEADKLSRQIRKEGYFQSSPIISAHESISLVRSIVRIDQARLLPVFVTIYDQLWQLLRALRNTFNPILGESYRLPPDLWAWHIAPNAASRGWALHRDAEISRPFGPDSCMHENGKPRLCTIWIPLTDATTHNSCIYVLPFPEDPAIQSFLQKESVVAIQQHAQLTNWSNVRALPAQAGSVLGWNPYIMHWGSQSTDWATHARVSVGIYYEAADAPMAGRPFDLAGRRYINLHDTDFQLSFENRLTIIANILATYVASGQMVNEPNYSPAVKEFCQRWKP